MSATILPDTDAYENPIVDFDFSSDMTSIDSAVVSIAVKAGRDVGIASRLDGALQITGSSVFQGVTGLLDGVDYEIRCEAVSGTKKRVRTGILPGRRE